MKYFHLIRPIGGAVFFIELLRTAFACAVPAVEPYCIYPKDQRGTRLVHSAWCGPTSSSGLSPSTCTGFPREPRGRCTAQERMAPGMPGMPGAAALAGPLGLLGGQGNGVTDIIKSSLGWWCLCAYCVIQCPVRCDRRDRQQVPGRLG
jgi:hypothetical protein